MYISLYEYFYTNPIRRREQTDKETDGYEEKAEETVLISWLRMRESVYIGQK